MSKNPVLMQAHMLAMQEEATTLAAALRLLEDVAEGRRYVVLFNHSPCSIFIRGTNIKVVCDGVMKVQRYTQQEAHARVKRANYQGQLVVMDLAVALAGQLKCFETAADKAAKAMAAA